VTSGKVNWQHGTLGEKVHLPTLQDIWDVDKEGIEPENSGNSGIRLVGLDMETFGTAGKTEIGQ
jgi:hypothetical protein